MAINPIPINIESIFGSRKYYIDFYQREYKWNDEQQSYKPIKSLLDDIFYRFELNYKKDSDISEEVISKYDWYYLNSFMTNTVGGNTFVVDGQQRLTTLTILSIALLKIGEKLGANKGKLTYIEKKVCDYDAEGNYVFWMGFTDREKALKAIFENDTEEFIKSVEGSGIAEKNIYAAYEVIYQYIEGKLADLHIFDAFRLYLYKRVMLIQIDVDDAKDVAMAFEVINDRGIPLKAYEILKGKILGVIDKSEIDPYVMAWEKSINKISDDFGDEYVDDFLGTYFQSKYTETNQNYRDLSETRYHKSIYLEEYDKRIGFKHSNNADKSYINNVKNFVKNTVPFYSDLYIKILGDCYTCTDKGNEYVWFNDINDQEAQFYLIMAAIDYNDVYYNEKYTLVSKLFDKFYTILNLTGSYRSSEFAAKIIELGIAIRNKSLIEIEEVFNNSLIEIINKIHGRNDITDPFKYELFSNIGYRDLGKRFMRYFFARIDKFIANECQLSTGSYYSLISQAKGKDVYHIDHILANDEKRQNLSLFKDEEEYINQRNRLGGLVLLKGKDNQSSGNEVYKEKLKTYVGNGTLFAQTLLKDFKHKNKGFENFCIKYNLDFKTYDIYDKVAIEERQKLLHSLVKIIWE
ncbi:DUF262 domain-containing protein [Clostridium sp. YIM B02500]|uniref:DUF262 domain-containing protein n=1 Tax=Clostridium sp. YIM B02500 TaxID=2910681 RepID=UPI001EEF2667|nr:DUF262 domain-containing protein [Clostridium sp. YIM B02500]